jgi:hypothetical protein
MHSVVSNVPVDDETPVVTLGVSRSVGAQSFEGAHRGRVCVCVFIGVSLCACYERLYCTVQFLKNKKKEKLANMYQQVDGTSGLFTLFCHSSIRIILGQFQLQFHGRCYQDCHINFLT